MTHETEAAGLLRSGNLFVRRAALRRAGEAEPYGLAGVKPGTTAGEPGAFAIYFGDEPFYHFDLDGRWQRIFDRGTHFRKGLDGRVDALARRREGASLVMRRRTLPFAEAADLDEQARSMALKLLAGRDELVPPPDGSSMLDHNELRELLERVARWDAEAWFRHREAFLAAYTDPPPLPPDARLAALFQARRPTDGEPRTPPEFERHAWKVLELHGRRIAQVKGAYLHAASLFQIPHETLVDYLEVIRRLDLGRVIASLNDLAPPLPDLVGWRRSAERGLDRVWVEAGPAGATDELRSALEMLHEAGIGVSLAVTAAEVKTEIAERIRSLALKPGDSVFVLGDESDRAGTLLRNLRAIKPAGVKVVPYDPDRWA
jgi:hypothetical protein